MQWTKWLISALVVVGSFCPPHRREQHPLHLRGKTHFNDCWVAIRQHAIEKSKAWNQLKSSKANQTQSKEQHDGYVYAQRCKTTKRDNHEKTKEEAKPKSHVRFGVKKFTWQEILGNYTLIVSIKRHSIPWAIELKFVFDLEKQIVIPFYSTIASSFWATTTLVSSKNITSKYPCINKMINLKDSCICSCMQSLISLWHGKQQMHLAMTICWPCFSLAFLLDWTHNQEKFCATSHA
jgi:hypothetical protein